MPYNNSHIKGWLRVIIFIIAYLFFGLLFYLFGILVAGTDFNTSIEQTTELQRVINVFFRFLASLSVLWLLLKIIDQESFLDMGLRLKNRTKDIIFGSVLGVVIMGLGFFFLLSIGEIDYDKINFNFLNLIYLFLLHILVSLNEELVVRGYFLRNLIYSFGKPIALVVSSFLFSIMHGDNPNFDYFAFINLFLAGIMLGLPYVFNRNLWLPIALHFSWNFFQSLFGFNVSGLDSYSLVEFNIPENNIINGGSFGFEGSILSIIVQVIVIIGFYVWYSKRSINEFETSNPN